MIPDDRPVLGKDLDVVRQQLGLLASDACWLFGLSMTRWMHIVRRDADLPLNDPTMALLVRFLDANPELSILPKFPEPPEMLELLNKVQQVDGKKAFPVMLGSDASAGYRWLQSGGKQGPAVSRLMLCLKLALQAKAPENRAEVIDNWRDVVKKEAITRDSLDVFQTGKWNTKAFMAKKEELRQAADSSESPKPKKGARKKEAKPA
jgi:hypothetical protein